MITKLKKIFSKATNFISGVVLILYSMIIPLEIWAYVDKTGTLRGIIDSDTGKWLIWHGYVFFAALILHLVSLENDD